MSEYYTIAVIALLAAISPGPDFVVVTKNAIAYHRRHAVITSLGTGIGILVHSTYCVLGLAIVISQSLLLFSLIKYLGASYLIYLGIKSLFAKNSETPSQFQKSLPDYGIWLAFRDGLLTNVLNPKATLFMLSVFTLVVKPHTPIYVQAIYAIEIAFITTTWFIFLSYGMTHSIVRLKIKKVQQLITKLIGTVLITLGIVVIFESR